MQLDLFAAPTCGACHQMDPAELDSGARYCWGEMHYRRPTDLAEGCSYRDEPRIPHALRRAN